MVPLSAGPTTSTSMLAARSSSVPPRRIKNDGGYTIQGGIIFRYPVSRYDAICSWTRGRGKWEGPDNPPYTTLRSTGVRP